MKRIRTLELLSGMVLAEDTYSNNHRLLFAKNTVLNETAIAILKSNGIRSVGVTEDSCISKKEIKKSEYTKKVESSKQFQDFKQRFFSSTENLSVCLNDLVEKNVPINVKELLQQVMSIIPTNFTGISVFDMLQNMRHFDDSTYFHCMNVALISNMLSQWANFSEEDVETATLCGLLHDVGKLLIPSQIIQKPDKLSTTEYELIKTHTLQGYSLLKLQDIDVNIQFSALMHHERADGSGYPYGIKGKDINRFAKIVTIADVYDAMTAARVYRGPLCPFTVISIFEDEGLQRYDSSYILTFLERIVDTYMGYEVLLSDGRQGTIIMINKNNLSKPIVNCNSDFIDLSKQKNLQIKAII